MKVLLRQNVSKLGKIGDVVDVKAGYARNYLLPHGLAAEPTEGNVRAVEAAKQAYLEEVAKVHAALEAKAQAVHGTEITIAARANEEGHLYGSVGPAQIAAALAAEGVFLKPENIILDDAIRQLDKYDVQVSFAEDVTTVIHVWVVPHHEEGDELAKGAEAAEDQGEEAADASAPQEQAPDDEKPE